MGVLSLSIAPAIEPVTLSEALVQCSCFAGIEDDWFNRAIKTARISAEQHLRRSIITQTWEYVFDTIPKQYPIVLPRGSVISLTSVKVYDTDDTETIDTLTKYRLNSAGDPATLSFNYGYTWPDITYRETEAIKITYTAGYGASASNVPSDIIHAILLHISWQYENKSGEVPVPDSFYNALDDHRMHVDA